MPFKDEGKLANRFHVGALRRLVKDDRLSPQRRLLAEMILLFLEGKLPYEAIQLAFGFGAKGKVQMLQPEEEIVDNSADKAADTILKRLYGEVEDAL